MKLSDIAEEVSEIENPDGPLLTQVIELTRDVNLNLQQTITHTDRLINRQNILIGICPIIIILLGTMLFFVYNFRRSQELVQDEMQMIHYHMSVVESERRSVRGDLEQMHDAVEMLKVMIDDSTCTETP